ncbi:unnamed protein product [Lasius platythorax]|uniref:Uncharacterized protein n=2 Tax=Lasius TaxID=488720 RepID=A0A0J7KZA1_LASNI|nr:hypothetical protein RF55_4208 [Lasius niger]
MPTNNKVFHGPLQEENQNPPQGVQLQQNKNPPQEVQQNPPQKVQQNPPQEVQQNPPQEEILINTYYYSCAFIYGI